MTGRFGVPEPTVGLLSNGEEPGKGDALRKAAWPLLAEVKGWVGNVEGRDLVAFDVQRGTRAGRGVEVREARSRL